MNQTFWCKDTAKSDTMQEIVQNLSRLVATEPPSNDILAHKQQFLSHTLTIFIILLDYSGEMCIFAQ